MTRLYFIFILSFVSITHGLDAQKIIYEPGEVLISLPLGENPRSLLKEYTTFRGQSTDIKATQIIAEPMNIWCLSVDHKRINLNDFSNDISNHRQVRLTQKNYRASFRRIPNDPQFDQQWQYINDGLNGVTENIDTDIDRAWDITTGGVTPNGDTIVICVVDDGMDENHNDFDGNLWVNNEEIPNNGRDDDNNGYIDDIYGWDSIEDDANVFREGGHGTSVAGIIGAKGNNSIGVSGVNWNVKIMTVRGGSNVSNAIKAYTYPYTLRKKYNETNGREGAFVVATNASWGFDEKFEYDAPIFCEFYDVLGEIGILNVCATTNSERNVEEDGDLPSHCSSPYLLVVTNLSSDGLRNDPSGYGSESVDLAAPGEDTYTTAQPNRYRDFCCTSAAAPHVTGTVGLIYATNCSYLSDIAFTAPSEAALLSRNIITGSTTPNPNMEGYSVTEGHLNIGNAVELSQSLCDDCIFPLDIDHLALDDRLILSWNMPQGSASTNLRYRIRGQEAWTILSNLSNTVELDNLNPCEVYEVQLSSNCTTPGDYGGSYFLQTDNCCKIPNNVTALIEGDNLKIKWDNITAADSYTVSYRDILDAEFTTEDVTENSFVIPGVTSCAGYDYQVRSNCALEITRFTSPQQIAINCNACQSQEYCGDVFMDNEFEWIETVILANSVFNSGFDVAGYGNFVGSPLTNLTQGSSNEMAIVPGFNGGSFTEYAQVYIDWNQDGNFSEQELALDPDPQSDTLTGTIQVPEDALPGNTRMRVLLSFEDFNTPCKNLSIEYGEIEDYCINVQSIGECADSVSIDDFITTQNSIALLWTDITNASGYQLEYRLLGESDFISVQSDGPTGIISELEDCSTYEVRVEASCSGNSSSTSPIVRINTRCGTSISDPEKMIHSYHLFPNPVKDELHIQIDGSHNANDMLIRLYDINGKELRQEKLVLTQGRCTLSDISDLPPGIIILQGQIGSALIADKIVKL